MSQIIIDHLWQSTWFAVLVGLVTLAFRSHRAHVRFCLWLSASIKFLIPFPFIVALGSSVRWDHAPTISPSSHWSHAVLDLAATASVVPVSRGLVPTPKSGGDFESILWTIWTCGAVFLLLRSLFQWRKLQAVIRDSRPAPIETPVPVLVTRSQLGPGLIGLVHPVLMLPEAIMDRLTSKQMSVLVAHELCHWRRRDNVTAALHMLVQTLFWFHPLVWWIGARLVTERECACDEAVVDSGNDRSIYAESILEVGRFYVRSPLAPVLGVSGGNLADRVKRILRSRRTVFLSWPARAVLLGVAALSLLSPFLYGLVTPQGAAAQTQSSMPSDEEIAQKRAEQAQLRTSVPLDPSAFDKFVGDYQHEKAGNVFFHITRDGDHFYSRLTGQQAVEFFPESATKFFAKVVPAQISFNSDPKGGVTDLVLHQNGREQVFKRVDASVEKASEEEIQRRIEENKPDMERQSFLHRVIEAEQRGREATEIMTPELKVLAEKQLAAIQAVNKRLGKFQSLEFLHVNRQGWDVYEAKYENGRGIWSVAPLSADHKLAGIWFQQ